MSKKSYTHSEISRYVNFRIAIHVKKNPEKSKKALTSLISSFPEWQQTLLVERKDELVMANRENMDIIYEAAENKKKKVNGFYKDGIDKEFNHISKNRTATFGRLVWNDRARGVQYGYLTMQHEHGHNIDSIMGTETGFKGNYSDNNFAWMQALQRETKEFIKEDKLLNKPYGGYRPLMEHLALYDNKQTHPAEAFAEMNNHYTTVYRAHKGDEDKINEVLSDILPHLWPVYRDEVIPQMKKYAKELEQRKEKNIDKLTKTYELYCKLTNKSFDKAGLIKSAGLFSAAGELKKQTTKTQEALFALSAPITDYVMQMNLTDLRKAKLDGTIDKSGGLLDIDGYDDSHHWLNAKAILRKFGEAPLRKIAADKSNHISNAYNGTVAAEVQSPREENNISILTNIVSVKPT